MNSVNTAPVIRGRGRPPDVNGEDTRDEIRKATQRLIAAHGYQATTTKMIALEVGITAAAVHKHFGRKRDLVLSVWHSTTDVEHAILQEAIDRADTFAAKVHALFDTASQFARRDETALRFASVITEDARRSPELRPILKDTRFSDLERTIIEFGVETGAIHADDFDQAQEALRALKLGATLLALELEARPAEYIVAGCKSLFGPMSETAR